MLKVTSFRDFPTFQTGCTILTLDNYFSLLDNIFSSQEPSLLLTGAESSLCILQTGEILVFGKPKDVLFSGVFSVLKS